MKTNTAKAYAEADQFFGYFETGARCTQCHTYWTDSMALPVVTDCMDGERVQGCPTCKTDRYLIDVVPLPALEYRLYS